MKIAVLSAGDRVVGGIETHLAILLPGLLGAGHEVAFVHERTEDPGRPALVPEGMPRWSVDGLGGPGLLERLRRWEPDVVYGHGWVDSDREAAALRVAASVVFSHAYAGACVSGRKSHAWPGMAACHRPMGPACLALYLPRRCGGVNPLTLARLYLENRKRLAHFRECGIFLTASEWMAEVYRRQGLGDRVRRVHLPVPPPPGASPENPAPPAGEVRLLFLGRIAHEKGGRMLVQAAPRVAAALNQRVQVTFAGDGPDRESWQREAEAVAARHPRVSFRWTGWVDAVRRGQLLRESHLLVVPSLWPEPFGQVGLEAGHFGVPSAAYALGGIPSWLEEGRNGALAPADPATAGGLAEAIARCLADPAHYGRLADGAREAATRHSLARHLQELEEAFAQARAAHRRSAAG